MGNLLRTVASAGKSWLICMTKLEMVIIETMHDLAPDLDNQENDVVDNELY